MKEENDNIVDVNSDSTPEVETESVIDESNEMQHIEEGKEEEVEFDIYFKATQNKHKIDGKHSLNRDVIFNGRLEEAPEEDLYNTTEFEYYNDNVYKIEIGSDMEKESKYNEDYVNDKRLEEDIYKILDSDTSLCFLQSRRKPNRALFNKYYELLTQKLSVDYTRCEIFCSLSFYFTDNIFNMFKLLDKKHATTIIKELKNKGYLKDIGEINFV